MNLTGAAPLGDTRKNFSRFSRTLKTTPDPQVGGLVFQYTSCSLGRGEVTCLKKHLPVTSSLGTLGGIILRSCKGTSTPSIFPNMEDKPKQKSMMKKRMDHKGEMGILVIASVKTIKAKPVPSTPCGRFQKLQN